MNKNGIPWLAGGLALVLVLNGCNVFEAMGTKHTSELSYQGLLQQGNSALEAGNIAMNSYSQDTAAAGVLIDSATILNSQGHKEAAIADSLAASAYFAKGATDRASASANFVSARDYYEQAMKRYPEGSEAYLFHAQAVVHLYGIDYARVNNEFNKSSGLPFLNQKSTVKNVDSIYYPVTVAVNDLEHILRLEHDSLPLSADVILPPDGDTASDGRISPSVVRIDLGILSAVKALLAPIDMDQNGHINDSCGVNPNLSDSLKLVRCEKGYPSEALRMANIDSATQDFKLDAVDTKSVTSRKISDNPNDINQFINTMKEPMAGASYNLDTVHSSLLNHNEKDLASTIQKRTEQIRSLNDFIGYLRYNDGIDNDYDGQNVALPTPMKWHNFDRSKGNHGIRFDYDSASKEAPYLKYCMASGYNFGNPGDIGHPFHRYIHRGAMYETYAALIARYPNLAKDSTANGRINLMKKNCKDIVTGIQGSPLKMPDTLASSIRNVCDTFSTVLKTSITPPKRINGTSGSEWISGTAGVDEELLDGFDNDYDGITDEDARNLRGYDDDDDAPLDTTMVGSSRLDTLPMKWKDLNHNGCIDINKNQTTTIKNQLTGMDSAGSHRVFCLGTLENRLFLARHHPDSLDGLHTVGAELVPRGYYEPTNTEPSNDCIVTQYNRLDAAFLREFNATPAEKTTACSYKHIPGTVVKPGQGLLKNSEWTGGVFGVDEEICGDGIDNDGDGWIDEDCGDH